MKSHRACLHYIHYLGVEPIYLLQGYVLFKLPKYRIIIIIVVNIIDISIMFIGGELCEFIILLDVLNE